MNFSLATHGTTIRSALIATAVLLNLLPAVTAEAAFRSWTDRDGSEITEAELAQFDFSSKEIICRERDGNEHRIPTTTLDTGNRMRLLFSPQFIRTLPAGSGERGYFLLLAVMVPAVLLLVSFFLSAIVLTKSLNPLRAIVGWVGSVLLGGFLMGVYLFLSSRSPEAAMGITAFGIVVVSALLSLYVSIIYRTTVIKGFKLLALHVFGALFLILIAVLVVRFACDPVQTDEFLEENVFRPTGLS